MRKLDKILYPESIAIIGASEKEGSVGNELLKKILEFKYKGKIYPINPKHSQILNIKCYKKVTDILGQIDLAIIAVPVKVVLGVIDECHLAQIENVIIISSGFKEVGGEGESLEKELKEKVQKYNINLVGPNCLGVFNAYEKLSFDGCFAPTVPKIGTVGFATQSGALAGGVFNISESKRVGFSQMVSLGNQADVDALTVLEQWESDDNVKQILLYLESITDPIKFRKVATRVARKKPILAIKSGRSEQGAKAAASHTGSLAGTDSSAEGLLASCGIVREYTLKEMFNDAQVLGNCPLPKGKKLGIITNAGGPGILATDSASDYNLEVPTLSLELQQKLEKLTLPQASKKNPVDLVASASMEHYRAVVEEMLKCDEVDMLLVVYLYITGRHDMDILRELEVLKKKYPQKPIVLSYMTTPDFFEKVKTEVPNATIPMFDDVTDAIRGLSLLVKRKQFLEDIKQKTPIFEVKKESVEKIFAKAKKEARSLLTTKESLEIFKIYGLSEPKWGSALNLSQAEKLAKKIGYPLVLKISSKQVSHKTDFGGVVVGIQNQSQLKEAFLGLEEKCKNAEIWKSLDGIIVMEQVKGSQRELVAGIVDNGNYGYQMMFGIGGIFVEALKEVCFRPCPLSMKDAQDLIESTKAKNIMGSIRGKKAVDKNVVIESLLRLSQLVGDFKQIKELDVNPFMIDEDGKFLTVDARIVTK